MRTTDGLPTDYTFTGQKLDASSGLMYYGARYYDAYLNRWVQPDSIIPDVYNPQSLNRYAYVRNNPVTYNDPTGHCDPDDCTFHSDDSEHWYVENRDDDGNFSQSDRLAELHEIAQREIRLGATDAEAFQTLTLLDAAFTKDKTDDFVEDLTLLTWGWHAADAPYCGLHGPDVCATEGRIVQGSAFNWPWRGGTGFLPSYRDPPGLESNQVGHFWEYVAATYHLGPIIGPPAASVGNDIHELFGRGNSWQDHALGERGIELGELLSRPFLPLKPSDVPAWIRYNLAAPR